MERFREVVVGEGTDGTRLDRWLSQRFFGRTRSMFARAIRAGMVTTPAGQPLHCAHRVAHGEVLRIFIPGIAATTEPPPFPPILYSDDEVVAVDKPAGLLAHPSGTAFAWALISLAKVAFPTARVDLVHRLDRDTSGVLLLTTTLSANRRLKEAVATAKIHKEYEAIVRGTIPWDERSLVGPIGPANGPIRVQMAVTPNGLAARTDVTVLERANGFTRVRCVLHTGRTHQIRVHLDDAGFPLLGDRLYGVSPEVFLRIQDTGVVDDEVFEASGAPRQALHARRTVFPSGAGHPIEVVAPIPADMARWWADPSVLPLDR